MINRKKVISIILTVLIIIGVISGIYALLHKSNSSYSAARASINTIKDQVATVKPTLSNSLRLDNTASTTTSDAILGLSLEGQQIMAQLDTLSKSDFAAKDPARYAADSQVLSKYARWVTDLATAENDYLSVHIECEVVLMKDFASVKSVNDFNKAADGCQAALDIAAKAPSQDFNAAVLTQYVKDVQTLVAVLKTVSTAQDTKAGVSAILNAYAQVEKSHKKITLTPPVDPTASVADIQQLVTSQKPLVTW